ncbi:hypothetical protein Ddye_031141 [Dipteronia dyeriana]|uniref:Uncharacterized protein n=1 Tax=Dipteronia dyeriana TaxID=168575 RepID=A0AAD9TIQ1_9ROSI|nr:hypothetical protein Ddye_031141 [Dipteronia dyeriana]
MSRSCSQCGNNGHNSRTCAEAAAAAGGGGGGGGGSSSAACSSAENGIMLFGVRVVEASSFSFRKSASMTNLSQFDQPPNDSNADAGYVSDDVVHASARSRERKRGVPWTEEEHKLFLLGLQKVGKGDWRGISRNFVKTRTPTQVASHAQKYFLRRFNHNRRRRRSSLFDITTDTVCFHFFLSLNKSHYKSNILLTRFYIMNLQFMGSSMEIEEQQAAHHQETATLPPPQPQLSFQAYPVVVLPVVTGENPKTVENFTMGTTSNQRRTSSSTNPIRPIPILPAPPSAKMADLNLNQKPNHVVDSVPLSLKLSTTPSSSSDQSPPPSTTTTSSHSSAFQAMTSGGDSIISVA